MVSYDFRPAALLVADGKAAAGRAAAAAELAGCRVSSSASIEGALALLRDPPPFELVIAELDQDRGELLDHLLSELDLAARHGKPVIISSPFCLVDQVAAQAWAPGVKHLSEPSDEEMAEALAEASQATDARLHDGKARLQQLSHEAARIARALAALSESADPDQAGEAATAEHAEIDAGRIRAIIRARRLREHFFPADLFADPAWDMLLDLMAARLDGQHVAVSSLCIAAAVPATTALRWIKALTEQGLFVRVADPTDGRRVHIELSDGAAQAVLDYLRAAQRLGAPII